uniref:Methyltransferase domain-containing protein n=1 Tax=Candidatus Kentrum sp. FM TaxID=2126340 RepID=A0A450WDV5_9GAMM|nr:MAG: Methyltransferase domain-containing protein [Candidatus Kentron sp. FM]VFJ63554.1 MAG: Methyltransferase domain-containing protein [Candidatus Kentron sp. FM]VFK15194.1 MAG: Methyltransferase domain-containing protein [Candidatus Kentron sp. FM]
MVHEHPAAHTASRQRLHRWLSCPSGKALLDTERKLLDGVLPHLFGHYILQVGRLGDADLLARSRIPHRVVVEVDTNRNVPGYPRLRAEPHALPVASDSVDVVVLPHLLEFSPHMQETIQEAERILVAEGHLLILAFNAWSLVGIRCLLCRRAPHVDRHSDSCLPCPGARFPGINPIKNRIAVLGFDIISIDRYFFQPPAVSPALTDRLRFLDVMGPRFWPLLSGAYFIVAKKRVTTLTPIKRRRQQPRRLLIAAGLGESSSCRPASERRPR